MKSKLLVSVGLLAGLRRAVQMRNPVGEPIILLLAFWCFRQLRRAKTLTPEHRRRRRVAP